MSLASLISKTITETIVITTSHATVYYIVLYNTADSPRSCVGAPVSDCFN